MMQTMQPTQYFVHPHPGAGMVQQHTMAYITPNGVIFQQPIRMVDFQQAQEQQHMMQLQQQFNQQLWAQHNPNGVPRQMLIPQQLVHPPVKSNKSIPRSSVPLSPSMQRSIVAESISSGNVSPRTSSKIARQYNKAAPRTRINVPSVIIPQSPSTPIHNMSSPEDYSSDCTSSTISASSPSSGPFTSRTMSAEQDEKAISDFEARACMRRAKRRHECTQTMWFGFQDAAAASLFSLRSPSALSPPRPIKQIKLDWITEPSQHSVPEQH